jgi:hypothetical protein
VTLREWRTGLELLETQLHNAHNIIDAQHNIAQHNTHIVDMVERETYLRNYLCVSGGLLDGLSWGWGDRRLITDMLLVDVSAAGLLRKKVEWIHRWMYQLEGIRGGGSLSILLLVAAFRSRAGVSSALHCCIINNRSLTSALVDMSSRRKSTVL